MNESVIGVDIGGTNVRVGLVNDKLELVRKATALTDSFGSADELFAGIRDMIGTVDPGHAASKIGIAMPVPWKRGTTHIVDAVNIPYLENVPVAAIASQFPGCGVYFENDVNVIAALEAEQGASRDSDHSIYITVSTGIGSGIILHREVLHGAHGYAGEIGSMIISDKDNNHASLYCGTLESLCSGKALEEESKRLFGEDATTMTLFERYHRQDERAVAVIGLWVEYFSRAIASLMQTLDPDVFVLGGSVIDNNLWLIDNVLENTRSKVMDHLKAGIRIVSPAFGGDAGVIGAGYSAWKQANQIARRQTV
ncbi:ROK family protein [Paenibacillus lycopersici]|uniref:ROK family protein n=1 Tax=Paenibacillus lycopersici TaxID=2704462 RepID=A0A6C0G5R3_9BACL|nr:ROK family protein [Paenibacillus lycopersici]QHT63551.1 ROK family protein [Paenibacillus lycopersici]